MVNNAWNFAPFKFKTGAIVNRAAAGRHRRSDEVGHGLGPHLQVFIEVFGPLNGETRIIASRVWDGRIIFFEPIEGDPVFHIIFPLGEVRQRAVWPRIGAVIGCAARGAIRRHRLSLQIFIWFGTDFISEIYGQCFRLHRLLDTDDIGPDKFMSTVFPAGAEVFNKNTTRDVISMQFTNAI